MLLVCPFVGRGIAVATTHLTIARTIIDCASRHRRPTILSGFRAFGWLELITLPVILSVIVVLVLEWDSTCRMIEDRERNVDPIALRTFFIAKTVTALATWIANAVMSRTAGELYDQCIGPQQETVRLIQEKEDEIRVQTGGTKSKLLSMLDKRTLIDASLQAGLEMIVKRDELLTSWIYRAYQLCFLPDMMMDIMMLYLLSRFVAVEQEHCKYHDGNKNSLNMLMALALWAAITLAFRTAIVSTWLARALFFADKAGLYHWGYKWCEEKDEKLFFGSEVARKTYASLYSRHRKERIQAKLAPLGARTHEALLKLNIFDLSSQRRRYRRKIVEVEDKLDQYTSRYNEIYEETGKTFIKRDSGHYEHRISYQWPETESPPPPRPSSLEDPEPNTERSRFGYNLVKTKQGRQAPPPLSKRHALPPLSKRRPRTESVSRTLSGDSNASDMSPITKRVEASMKRALLKKQLSSGRMGMEEGPPLLHRAPDTIVELNDAAGVAPPPRLSTHEEFYDTYSGDDLEGGPALEETDDDDLGAAVADRRRRKLSTAV